MATIDIVDLKIRAIIGTHPWERTNKQELTLNITLEYNASKAAKSDRLEDALDYEQIVKTVLKVVERSKCQLLERLAQKILDSLKKYSSIERLTLRIDKPQAIALAKSISYKVCL